MKDFKDFYMEKIAERPTEAKILQGTRPKAVVVMNPNDSYSKPFVQRLDKVLVTLSGFDRLEFIALDIMKDRHVVNRLGFDAPSLNIVKNGKIVASLPGKNTMENEILKFFNDNRKSAI